MSFFDWLRRAFAGSGASRQATDTGLYFYVKLQRGGEVVQLRLDPQYELVPDYDEGGYITRKSVVGPMTFQRAEATFRFDENRQLQTWDISGGDLVSQEEWDAQQQKAGPGR